MTPCKEVSKGTEHETSVQKAENRPWVRKSARVQSMKLPSKMRKRGLWYGSQQVHGAGNFRPKRRKGGLGTEVRKGTEHETSVQNIENRPLGRKSGRLQDNTGIPGGM